MAITSTQPITSSCVIYEWRSWHQFLLPKLLPGATRISACVNDSAERIQALVPLSARHFFFHLNNTFSEHFVSRRDALISQLQLRGIVVVNAKATDMSKRAVWKACRRLGWADAEATQGGDPDELLMVKTNLNAAGANEELLTWEERLKLGVAATSKAVWEMLAARRTGELYPVLKRRDIPATWWNDRQLVIERFITNKNGLFYRVHRLFAHTVVAEGACESPIKKLQGCPTVKHKLCLGSTRLRGTKSGDEFLELLLAQTSALCSAMNIEYGSLDVVLDDAGNHYFVDVNTCPYSGRQRAHPVFDRIFDHLRNAIE